MHARASKSCEAHQADRRDQTPAGLHDRHGGGNETWRVDAVPRPPDGVGGVPGVAQGVPCPGSSPPASSPTITYHIAGDHTINNYYYTTNNYTNNYYTYATRRVHAPTSVDPTAASARPLSAP
jgi:hypothetical protein